MTVSSIWNHPILFIGGGIIILYMIGQSILFMKMGYKEAISLGIEKSTLHSIIKSSIGISILPTLPIIISLFILVPVLGMAIPWLRLSVIGSAMFEMIAAEMGAVAGGAPGLVVGISPEAWISAIWVMCIGGAACLLTALIFIKPFCASYDKIAAKNATLFRAVSVVAIVSLISSSLVDSVMKGATATGTILGCCVFGYIINQVSKKSKSSFLNDMVLPLTLLFGLGISIVIDHVIL